MRACYVHSRLVDPFLSQVISTNLISLDPETSGEETKVRLRWSWCQQARHSSEEAEKVNEQLRTSLCIAGSDADKHDFAIFLSSPHDNDSLAHSPIRLPPLHL
jgi:hypothetical protein